MVATAETSCCPPLTQSALSKPAATRLAEVFAVLANPARLRLFSLIASQPGGTCACDMVDLVDRSQPTVSHHLKVLHEGGLVTRVRRGRWIWYQAHPASLADAASLLNCS
ncbi:MAG: metalloregulator ArsR/SmtB family transcription factor [Acidimicrobiales bacterium]|jgi:ArsR family transcriptional regulator|nr:metalloregulator ArsR/SmtB family transcription factor [Acidimicrobiales bacterium]